jgi:flagellar biogenesis protein FliO
MLFSLSRVIASQGLIGITNSSPDLVTSSLKMIIFLSFLLAGLIAVGRFMKHIPLRRARKTKGRLITVLANERLGLKNYISLVEVPGCVLVVGITTEGISLLTKIKNENMPGGLIRNYTDAPETSFLDQLRGLSPDQGKTDIMKRAFSAISRYRIKVNPLQKVWISSGSVRKMATHDDLEKL